MPWMWMPAVTDSIFLHLFEVAIIRCDKMACDRETIHMIRSHAHIT